VRDFPGYSNRKAGGGPRTKRQRRRIQDARVRLKMQEKLLEAEQEELEMLRREPTLHSINWQPGK